MKLTLWLIALFILMVSADIISSGLWTLRSIDKDWISTVVGAAGNVAGGIIGGIVALFVARYQISSQRKAEQQKESLDYKTLLHMYIDDLRHIETALKTIVETNTIDTKLIHQHVTSPSWAQLRPLATRYMNRELQVECNKLDKRIMLIHLLASDNDLDIEVIESLLAKVSYTLSKLEETEETQDKESSALKLPRLIE